MKKSSLISALQVSRDPNQARGIVTSSIRPLQVGLDHGVQVAVPFGASQRPRSIRRVWRVAELLCQPRVRANLHRGGMRLGVLALASALCGCQSISYTSPTGEAFRRVSFGSKLAIASLSVTPGTNGTRGLELRGYENDSVQAIGAVTEAAIRGALAGLAPRTNAP